PRQHARQLGPRGPCGSCADLRRRPRVQRLRCRFQDLGGDPQAARRLGDPRHRILRTGHSLRRHQLPRRRGFPTLCDHHGLPGRRVRPTRLTSSRPITSCEGPCRQGPSMRSAHTPPHHTDARRYPRSVATSDSNTCTFPGCDRPVPRPSSPGRPPQYRDLPEHTRWRAWKERQRRAQEVERSTAAAEAPTSGEKTAGEGPTSKEAEPVTAARLRADDLLTRFAVQSEQLTRTLQKATEAFTTMTDPATAEAQVEAARLAGIRHAAEADQARLEAENRRREAEPARRPAGEAPAPAVATTQAAERMADEALLRRDTAEAERDRQAATAAQAITERDAATAEANAGLAAAQRRISHTLEQAKNQIAQEKAEAERRLQQARAEIEQLRRENTEYAQLRDEAALNAETAQERAARAEEHARQSERLRAEERARSTEELDLARRRHDSDREAAEV